jgi:hypothetical protein
LNHKILTINISTPNKAIIIDAGIAIKIRYQLNLFKRGISIINGNNVINCPSSIPILKLKGLEGTDYYLNLLSFNIGIELGQLITLLPLIILIPLLNRLSWYRILIAMPASIIIALFGVEMFIVRIL